MMTANGGAVVAIVIAAARKRVLAALRSASATSPSLAHRLDDLDRMASRQLQHLVKQGVVKEVDPGRYYLDESAHADWQARMRKRALVTMIVITIVGLVLIFAAR